MTYLLTARLFARSTGRQARSSSELAASLKRCRCQQHEDALSRQEQNFPANVSHESLVELLTRRGFVNQIAGSRETLNKILSAKRIAAYAGIDPTAPSLHLGHLVPLMVLFWLHAYGHHTISLVGGATARVGDPTGRLTSREALASSTHDVNLVGIETQVGSLWTHAEKALSRHGQKRDHFQDGRSAKRQIRNNAEWMDKLTLVDFLKYMGTGARMGTMLGRDTVKNKMSQGDGMSFAEFTYPLLQAWDWWHMYTHDRVQLQVGGSDQYGNIIAGADAINSMSSVDKESGPDSDLAVPIGLTVPLLTTSSGAKFGKSAGNAVWLDKTKTSAFDVYGFLLKSSDTDVGKYLRLFTFLPEEDVEATMAQHVVNPGLRTAQHLLAYEVLALVHGEEEAHKTAEQHRSMRRPILHALTEDPEDESTNRNPIADAPYHATLSCTQVYGVPMSRVLQHAGLAKSRSEGSRLLSSGGVYAGIKGEDNAGSGLVFTVVSSSATGQDYLVDNKFLVLRQGKWKVKVFEVKDEVEGL